MQDKGPVRFPTNFCFLPTDILRHLLVHVRPIDMYQMLFASFSLKKTVLKAYPDLNLRYWYKQVLHMDEKGDSDQLFRMLEEHPVKNTVWLYGSSLYAALRGEDWACGEPDPRYCVHDVDVATTENIRNQRSFAAKTRSVPQVETYWEWDQEVHVYDPKITFGTYTYSKLKTVSAMSVAKPKFLDNVTVEVIELQIGATVKKHTSNSPIRFLHSYWSGRTGELPVIRDPISVQLGEATFPIGGTQRHHMNKWIARAEQGLCVLHVTYGKKE